MRNEKIARGARRAGGSRARRLGLCALAVTGLVASIVLMGCEEEPPPVVAAPPPPPAPPPAPVKPSVTPISQLMASLSIDERIVLPESLAPDNDQDRRAVLEFFDAFARGDAQTLGSMMSLLDRVELDALTDSEVWDETIENIKQIQVQTGAGPYGEKCALAIFDVEGSFQPQLWYYKADGASAGGMDGVSFEAAPTPPGIMMKLYGDDFIGVWHEILEKEMALANEIDEDIKVAQVDLDTSEETGGGSSPGASPSTPRPSPGGSPGNPDRRPPGKKRKPPGAR